MVSVAPEANLLLFGKDVAEESFPVVLQIGSFIPMMANSMMQSIISSKSFSILLRNP